MRTGWRTARNAALAEAARTQRIERFMLSLFEGGDGGGRAAAASCRW